MGVKYSLRKCELTNPERKENCKVSDNTFDLLIDEVNNQLIAAIDRSMVSTIQRRKRMGRNC